MDHFGSARRDRNQSRGEHREENRGIAQKVFILFGVEIVAADVAKRIRDFLATAVQIFQARSLIVVFNERQFPRVFVGQGSWFHKFLSLSSLMRSGLAAHWIQKFFHSTDPYCNAHATRENKVVSRS